MPLSVTSKCSSRQVVSAASIWHNYVQYTERFYTLVAKPNFDLFRLSQRHAVFWHTHLTASHSPDSAKYLTCLRQVTGSCLVCQSTSTARVTKVLHHVTRCYNRHLCVSLPRPLSLLARRVEWHTGKVSRCGTNSTDVIGQSSFRSLRTEGVIMTRHTRLPHGHLLRYKQT